MYQQFTTELANQRRNQLMHEAETHRLTRSMRVARIAERKATFHRMAVSAISVLAWPIKH